MQLGGQLLFLILPGAGKMRYGGMRNVLDNVAVPGWPGHPEPVSPPGQGRKKAPAPARSERPQRS